MSLLDLLFHRRKFVVKVQGKGFAWLMEDGLARGGFFTTRLVVASSSERAAKKAVRMVEREPGLRRCVVRAQCPEAQVVCEKLREVESFGDRRRPGTGLIFYTCGRRWDPVTGELTIEKREDIPDGQEQGMWRIQLPGE